MTTTGRSSSLAGRLLTAQALVILAGGVTLLIVALVLAPGLFNSHVREAFGPLPGDLADHVDAAFAEAVLTSLAVAVTAAVVTAVAVSILVTRRIARPMATLADAATRIADGRYDVRVEVQRAGTELTQLSRAFNDMAAALAATERRRADLLRAAAHELRNPLATIRAALDGVRDGVLDLDCHVFATVDAELTRIRKIIDDLDTVSRAEEGRLDLHIRPTVIDDVVREAVRNVAAAYSASQVDLVVSVEPGLPPAPLDRTRFQQVLDNLLDNALRHTPDHGRVTLTARRLGGDLEVTIHDTGDGIPAEHLARVFERFYRMDTGRSRAAGGSGIGLTLCRALVEAHRGHVWADSAGIGAGSTFTVLMPLSLR